MFFDSSPKGSNVLFVRPVLASMGTVCAWRRHTLRQTPVHAVKQKSKRPVTMSSFESHSFPLNFLREAANRLSP